MAEEKENIQKEKENVPEEKPEEAAEEKVKSAEPMAQPTTQPKPQPQSGSKTGLIVTIVIIAIIVIAALAYGGWYLYKKSANSKTTTSSSTSTTPTVTSTTTTTSTISATKAGTMPTNSYVISDSNTRVISESELTSLTPWQLKVARNEIYARHGRPFVHKDLQCYFAKQSWYTEDPNFSENSLSAVENKNVNTILDYEKKINSPLYQKDSGC